MHAYRTHTCAQLRESNVGESVRLSGWVHRKRDHGGVLFIDLRDHYGITQIVADEDSEALALLDSLKSEHAVLGSVLLIVLLAEVRKVMIEDRVKCVPAPGYVLPLGNWNGRIPK